MLLTQCAIGLDWYKKRADLNLEIWTQHIRWVIPPARALAVPFDHDDGPNSVEWRRNSKAAGLLLDRLRLGELASRGPMRADLIPRMTDWCRDRLAQIRALPT
jgi:hypothetical protein